VNARRRTAVRGRTVARTAVRVVVRHRMVSGTAVLQAVSPFWPCCTVARLSFLLPFALLELCLTCILSSTPCKSYLCSQNPKVLPKNTDKPQYHHIWIKRSKSIPFSCGFSMKTEKNRDQERAKIGQNRGLSSVIWTYIGSLTYLKYQLVCRTKNLSKSIIYKTQPDCTCCHIFQIFSS